MADIKIEIDDAAVREAFNRLIALGEDPSQELDAIGRVLPTRVGTNRCKIGRHTIARKMFPTTVGMPHPPVCWCGV